MENKKYVKTFESYFASKMNKINEGGGSGIDFTAKCSVEYEYRLANSGLELVKKDIEELDKFDAIGYMDGRKNIDGSILKMEEGKGLDENLIKGILISDIVYNSGEEETLKSFPEWNSDDDSEMTIGDYLKKYDDTVLIINISTRINYSNMHFAGYTRGSFNVGDVVLFYDSKNGDVSDNSTIFIDKCEFSSERGASKTEISKFEKIMECIAPKFVATEEFNELYQEVFVDGEDEDDEDIDESMSTNESANFDLVKVTDWGVYEDKENNVYNVEVLKIDGDKYTFEVKEILETGTNTLKVGDTFWLTKVEAEASVAMFEE